MTSLSGARAPHVFLLHNRQASNFGQPSGSHLCERIFTLLQCKNLLDIRCGDTRQTERNAEKQAVAKERQPVRKLPQLQPRTTSSVPIPTRGIQRPADPLSIPDAVCGERHGVVALVKCGPETPRSAWVYVNNGYYKCRNQTHWLSGCRRYQGGGFQRA